LRAACQGQLQLHFTITTVQILLPRKYSAAFFTM
jgi:hypothetical protein